MLLTYTMTRLHGHFTGEPWQPFPLQDTIHTSLGVPSLLGQGWLRDQVHQRMGEGKYKSTKPELLRIVHEHFSVIHTTLPSGVLQHQLKRRVSPPGLGRCCGSLYLSTQGVLYKARHTGPPWSILTAADIQYAHSTSSSVPKLPFPPTHSLTHTHTHTHTHPIQCAA